MNDRPSRLCFLCPPFRIAYALRHFAALRLDCSDHELEPGVQQSHDVLGQNFLRELREASQVRQPDCSLDTLHLAALDLALDVSSTIWIGRPM